jgi:hypothetical protein
MGFKVTILWKRKVVAVIAQMIVLKRLKKEVILV